MARTYIAVPVDPAHAAEALASAAKAHRMLPEEAAERGYTGPPRILRLRARTGASVAERLATAEERLDSHRERLAAVEDFTTELRAAEETMVHRIGNLEGDILDHRTRIGDLEREPEPTGMDRAMAAAEARRASAEMGGPLSDCPDCGSVSRPRCERHGGEPSPVRPEPGSAAEDPDRLAKVAHRAADKLTTWGNLHEPTRDIYRAIASAVAEACCEDRAALLARAEKAERERDGRPSLNATLHALYPWRAAHDPNDEMSLAQVAAAVTNDWQKRGEELEALRAKPAAPDATRDPLTDPRPRDWFVDLGDDPATTEVIRAEGEDTFLVCRRYRDGDVKHYHWSRNTIAAGSRPMTPAEVAAFRRDGTRPSAPTPIVRVPTESAGADGGQLVQSEAEMAAELRREGWTPGRSTGSWHTPPEDALWYQTTADAHAAMRAAKGAR